MSATARGDKPIFIGATEDMMMDMVSNKSAFENDSVNEAKESLDVNLNVVLDNLHAISDSEFRFSYTLLPDTDSNTGSLEQPCP